MEDRITEEEFETKVSEMIIKYLKETGPEERQKLVISWNFDNFSEVIHWIVNSPQTDKGTILQLYWLMEPGYSKQFVDRSEVIEKGQQWYLTDFDIIENIEKNYAKNFYEKHDFSCDPYNDYWSVDRVSDSNYDEAKRDIPKIMTIGLNGKQIQKPDNWFEGISYSLQNEYDKLANLLDE